jgi:hypothetical protein
MFGSEFDRSATVGKNLNGIQLFFDVSWARAVEIWTKHKHNTHDLAAQMDEQWLTLPTASSRVLGSISSKPCKRRWGHWLAHTFENK